MQLSMDNFGMHRHSLQLDLLTDGQFPEVALSLSLSLSPLSLPSLSSLSLLSLSLLSLSLSLLSPLSLSPELYENLGYVGASIKQHLVEGMRNMWQQLNDLARSHTNSTNATSDQQEPATMDTG